MSSVVTSDLSVAFRERRAVVGGFTAGLGRGVAGGGRSQRGG